MSQLHTRSGNQLSAGKLSRRRLARNAGWSAGLLAAASPLKLFSHARQGEPVEIRFHAQAGTQGDYFQAQADAFHQTQDRVRVTVEVTPLSEYVQQLTTLLAGGQLGDGWWATPFSLLYSFSSRGVVMDLRDLAEEAGQSLDAFFPVNIQQLTPDDALIGWPLGTHAGWSSMYINLDAWEEAGAAMPQWEWTYTDEWLEAVQAATTEDRFGFMFNYQSQAAYTFIRSWGGDWIDPANGTESLVNSPETREALLFMHSLVHEHRVSPPEEAILPGDTSTTFVNGLTASWATGVFAVNTVESAVGDQFEWTTASMPAGPGGEHGSFVGIDSLCMNADTEHPEATFEWFLWLTSVEAGLAQMEAGLPPTARVETWDTPEIAENPHLQITRQWLEEVGPITFPANARVSELNTAFVQGFQALMLETDDPEAAIQRIHEEVQAVLEQPGF